MDLCTSLWFAEMSLEFIELKCLHTLKCSILIYQRYEDDCFLIARKDQINNIVDSFNNYNKHLQFIVEFEINNKISFIDLGIAKVDNFLPLTKNSYYL